MTQTLRDAAQALLDAIGACVYIHGDVGAQAVRLRTAITAPADNDEEQEQEPAAGPAWPAGPDGRRVGDPLPEPERGEGWPFPRDGAGSTEPPPDETVIELPKRGRRRSP